MLEFPAGEASSGGAEHGVTIVTLECAGVLPSGTAVEVVQHIEKAWARGQAAVEALRAELDVEDRDTLCPLVHGGRLLAIYSETDEDYSVDNATQTEIALREVHVEIHNWHTCLNAFCFCLLLLCMNLLYFQWLYTATKLTRL